MLRAVEQEATGVVETGLGDGRVRTVEEWREARSLAPHHLARMAGITTQTLARIEQGQQRPHYRTAVALAAALEIEVWAVAEFERHWHQRERRAESAAHALRRPAGVPAPAD